jgi:thiosulfate/3-mercaptopyruvate sulfurtransferase
MPYTTLIDAAALAAQLDNPDWVVVDARFVLREPDQGEAAYRAGHIPGAVYAHLDCDLSGPVIKGQTGRHPLPAVADITRTLGQWGIDRATQVIVYDDSGGMTAGRLWWLLAWLGHDAAALLDGGWPAWLAAGYPTRAGVETRAPRSFVPRLRPALVATTDEIAARLGDPNLRLLDARAAERFRGENETLDPVGGHIPGAISAPYAGNLGPDGHFLPPEVLRARFEQLLGSAAAGAAAGAAAEAICYCGSGVSAAHNLIAMRHAGLGLPRLYVGSWSEWVADGKRPVVSG